MEGEDALLREEGSLQVLGASGSPCLPHVTGLFLPRTHLPLWQPGAAVQVRRSWPPPHLPSCSTCGPVGFWKSRQVNVGSATSVLRLARCRSVRCRMGTCGPRERLGGGQLGSSPSSQYQPRAQVQSPF